MVKKQIILGKAEKLLHEVNKKKKFKTGKTTVSPFVNFLQKIKKTCQGMTPSQITSRGAEMWRKMDTKQKTLYTDLARQTRRRRRVKSRTRRKRTKRTSKTSRSKSRRKTIPHT
ncbi:unnamed protein product [Phaedon cochleariae]|uniref:HMG box domain-containing protein n=1 Tax=Phaedon cochleariae TaxID=80249 RepID=A0A9P0DGE7_PHACE|nr:unnamed protein product [Phaedon cochleariae]